MLYELKRKNYDVVYGHYIEKKHSWFRNLGSRFNDRIATLMLHKPKDLSLELQGHESFSGQRNNQISRSVSLHRWFDLSRDPKHRPNSGGASRQRERAVALYIAETGAVVAEHVSEFFDPAVADFGLCRSARFVSEHRRARGHFDRKAL